MNSGGRRWLEISVRCRTAGERSALLAEGLMTLGGRAAEERAGWYVTYVEGPDDMEAFLDHARRDLAAATGLDGIEVRAEWQDHEDWAETWKRGLALRRITPRIVVRPSWIENPEPKDDDIVIVLDPGMAFGTAEHGTTRGCLRLMDGVVERGQRVLDVGSGSGILSVAAARLGASDVVAIEGDALACEALRENVQENGVADRVAVVEAWATPEGLLAYDTVDGIVANIETGLLLPLLPGLVGALAPGGWLILSGVLGDEWDRVQGAFCDAGVDFVEVDEDGDWCSGLFKRPA